MLKTAICGGPACGIDRRITKIFSVMRLAVILLTAGFLNVSAKVVSQTVTFSGKNVPLSTVFNAVEKQTGYVFIYTDPMLISSRPVTVTARNQPLNDFLQVVFKMQPLQFEIKERVIILFQTQAPQQSVQKRDTVIDVRGRVVNEDGRPLSGVTVSQKGSTRATSTNNNGEFSLKWNGVRLQLVFTGVNVEAREMQLDPEQVTLQVAKNGDGINLSLVTLKTKVYEMAAVTVSTGYQTLSRERSTGAFAKPDMKVLADRSGSMNILQRMDGLVPGLP